MFSVVDIYVKSFSFTCYRAVLSRSRGQNKVMYVENILRTLPVEIAKSEYVCHWICLICVISDVTLFGHFHFPDKRKVLHFYNKNKQHILSSDLMHSYQINQHILKHLKLLKFRNTSKYKLNSCELSLNLSWQFQRSNFKAK